MIKYYFYLLVILCSGASVAVFAQTKLDIPLQVESVTSKRVNDGLIRVILYNTEVLPRLDVELIRAPNRTYLDRQVVTAITVNKKLVVFDTLGSVFIEDISILDTMIRFRVDYEISGRRGEMSAICQVVIRDKKLLPPACHLVTR